MTRQVHRTAVGAGAGVTWYGGVGGIGVGGDGWSLVFKGVIDGILFIGGSHVLVLLVFRVGVVVVGGGGANQGWRWCWSWSGWWAKRFACRCGRETPHGKQLFGKQKEACRGNQPFFVEPFTVDVELSPT